MRFETPLNGLIGFTELLKKHIANGTRAASKYVRNANYFRTSGALLGVISDILDFSKIEGGGRQNGTGVAQNGGQVVSAGSALDVVRFSAQ